MIGIDAHQHFWHPARGDYDWIPADDEILARPYHPSNLRRHLDAFSITRTVLVQAVPSIEETEYLLGIADATEFVGGVVGWIDFEKRDHRRHLQRFSRHPKFLGVRPMIQDIGDVDWMLRAEVQWGFEAVEELDLTFDALGFPRHLENFLTILKRYPRMRAVVDHCMKPDIREHSSNSDIFRAWADGIARLAVQTGAHCKLCGLVNEADSGWTLDDLRPYAGHVLEVFGADRVMWGSDWPVCRLRASYGEWRRAAEALTDHLETGDRARIFGGTAAEFYRLGV
jgi:L-fucono-1,5-lactonase